MARLQAEAGATVLERDPRARHHYPASEALVIGLDVGDHHAVGVGGTQVDGPGVLGLTRPGLTCLVGHERAALLRVTLVEQASHRHRCVRHVGDVPVGVGEGELHALHL
jgi:hypothetical protein